MSKNYFCYLKSVEKCGSQLETLHITKLETYNNISPKYKFHEILFVCTVHDVFVIAVIGYISKHRTFRLKKSSYYWNFMKRTDLIHTPTTTAQNIQYYRRNTVIIINIPFCHLKIIEMDVFSPFCDYLHSSENVWLMIKLNHCICVEYSWFKKS